MILFLQILAVLIHVPIAAAMVVMSAEFVRCIITSSIEVLEAR